MKLSRLIGVILSASLLAMPMSFAVAKGKDGMCMIEKKQEMVQNLHLNDHQKKLWDTYISSLKVQKENMKKVHAMHEEAMKTPANNAVEAAEKRLHTHEKMISMKQEQIKAMKVSVADLKAFYNSLDAKQKAEFDAAFKKMQEKHKEKMGKCKECAEG